MFATELCNTVEGNADDVYETNIKLKNGISKYLWILNNECKSMFRDSV
jgi:hypothetical protein